MTDEYVTKIGAPPTVKLQQYPCFARCFAINSLLATSSDVTITRTATTKKAKKKCQQMTVFQCHAHLSHTIRLECKNGLTYYSGLLRCQTRGSGMQFDFSVGMAGEKEAVQQSGDGGGGR